MLTVRRQQHSFSTHERMFLWKCQKRQNGSHFADDTFKRISLNKNVRISNEILLKFVPKGSISNIPVDSLDISSQECDGVFDAWILVRPFTKIY